MTSFSEYQAPELHQCAKHFKIKGHSKLKKGELVALLNSKLKILKSGEVKPKGRGGTIDKPPLQKTTNSSPIKAPKPKKPMKGGQLPDSILDKMKDLHLCLGGMIGGDLPGLSQGDKQVAKQIDKQKYPESAPPQIRGQSNISFLGPSGENTQTGEMANDFLNMLATKGANLVLTGADKYLSKAAKFDFVQDALTEAGLPPKTAEAVVNVINPYTVTKDVVTGVVNAWAYKYGLGKYKKSSAQKNQDNIDKNKPTYTYAQKHVLSYDTFNWDKIKDGPANPSDGPMGKTAAQAYGSCENALKSMVPIAGNKGFSDAQIEAKCPGSHPGASQEARDKTAVDKMSFSDQVDWYLKAYGNNPGGIQILEDLYKRRAGSGSQFDNDAIEAAIAKLSGQFDEEMRLINRYKDSQASSGGAIKDDEIDWEDIKWGSVTKQLEQYNAKMKKTIDLPKFAEMILKDPKKYKQKTVKRARFYKNVLQKK